MSTGASAAGTSAADAVDTSTIGIQRKKKREEQINRLIAINASLITQLQLQTQSINDLLVINKQILDSTQKMDKHIDFINKAYDKITKSYFFKHILG